MATGKCFIKPQARIYGVPESKIVIAGNKKDGEDDIDDYAGKRGFAMDPDKYRPGIRNHRK